MALEGTLEDMSLPDLFQIFQIGEKSGVLLLLHAAECGVIVVDMGRLIDAVLMNRANQQVHLTGEDAVLQMLQWQQANFTFKHNPGATRRSVTIHHTSNWLIMEALRRQKHEPQPGWQVVTLDTYVEPGSIANSTEIGMGLDLDHWLILDQVARSTPVHIIARDTNIAPDALIRQVTELVATGLLQVVPAPRQLASQPKSIARGGAELVPVSESATPVPRIGSVLLRAIQRRIRGL